MMTGFIRLDAARKQDLHYVYPSDRGKVTLNALALADRSCIAAKNQRPEKPVIKQSSAVALCGSKSAIFSNPDWARKATGIAHRAPTVGRMKFRVAKLRVKSGLAAEDRW